MTNGAERGRRSRVVLTPRRWRQVLRKQSDGDNKARSPGRSRRKPLKPPRAGMPGHPALPVVTNSYAFLLCMRGCGCVGTRHSPRLSHGKAENSSTTRTHSRRENADTRDPHSVIAREGGRSSIAEELMINREAAAYWIPAFAGMTGGACDKRKPFAYASAGECHAPCHRPRRRAIQYCRGADDQSRGRGVLDTRFRGYDGGACDQRKPFAHASAGECHSPCHRPRRRAIQYCRGADDQSTGRGVLDTRFRGYDDWAGLQKRPFANASAANSRAVSSPAKAGDPVLQRS